MPELDFIVKTPKLEKSQDYAMLRAEGLKHIEKLAHRLWTDYNVHDPGVTILELLCYAVTDLGYRTGYDVKDLLTQLDGGVAVNRANFHTALEILSCNPVSFDDLRKLLIDIRGVRNAWIEPHCSVKYCLDTQQHKLVDCAAPQQHRVTNPSLGGLFDVFLEYEDFVQAEPRLLRLGLPDNTDASGGFVQAQGRGIRFHVAHPLTLQAVSVYPETAGQVTLRLLRKDEQEPIASVTVTLDRAGEKTRIPLGFRIPPGKDYRLDSKGTAVKLYRTIDPSFPRAIESVVYLVSGVYGSEIQQPYFFFYDWEISYAAAPAAGPAGAEDAPGPTQPLPSTVTREDVVLAAKERLHTHRNLCEDFVNVCDLDTELVAVCADIEVSPSADVEQVLAEMFYRLGLHVSPAVSFYTIEELLDRGKTTDQIFEGPRLDHGFIDDDELQEIQRRCEIRTSDVVRILMDVDGVLAVKNISLLSFLDGEPRIQEPWVLELATDQFRAPEFTPDRSKIIFYKNDLPYYANREQVKELLKEKKAADLESKLKGHDRDLPVPVGDFKNPSEYYPLQNELPMNYRVGQIRVPASEGDLRKAQSRQLKAYLMFFEQLLANYLAQLAHVGELFSWEDAGNATYFTQEIQGIPDLDAIYHQGFIASEHGTLGAALRAIVEDSKTASERKSRFLEHLLGRFAESFTDYSLLMYSMLKDASPSRVNDDRRAFLQDYPRVSRERGTAYDYRYPDRPENLSGYQRRVYRLLGIRNVTRRDLAGHRFKIQSVEVLEDGKSVTQWRFVLEDEYGGSLFESIVCESRSAIESLLDFALGVGGHPDNYRLKDDGSAHELLRRCADRAKDEPIGATSAPAPEVLAEVQSYFAQIGGAEGFHVLEHVLLRRRTADDPFLPVQLSDGEDCGCVEVREPYSFRVSVVLPSWPERFQDLKFRRFVEDLLRFEAPAHVFARICWISHAQMKALEECYGDWSARLAELAQTLGGCRTAATTLQDAPLSGELPVPATSTQARQAYAEALGHLIDQLHRLVTVYPLARLHDCTQTQGDTPQITLNNTSLGTF